MKRKLIKSLISLSLLIIFLLVYYLLGGDNVYTTSENKLVTKVIDGDTILVQGGQTVRFLDVDCDEKGKQCYNEAKEYIENRLLNENVELISGSEDEDMYNRKLRYIFLDGVNINKELVANGYCVARFVEDNQYKEEIEQAEANAIANKVGCKWANLS